MHAKFAGSKRKAKLLARDERRVEATQKRLNRIYQLSKLIQSEQELDTYLAQIEDPELRAATRTLIEPFLLFRITRVDLATDLPAEKATVMSCDPRFIHRPGPQPVVVES